VGKPKRNKKLAKQAVFWYNIQLSKETFDLFDA
jgi:hypothetical protein